MTRRSAGKHDCIAITMVFGGTLNSIVLAMNRTRELKDGVSNEEDEEEDEDEEGCLFSAVYHAHTLLHTVCNVCVHVDASVCASVSVSTHWEQSCIP